MTTIHADELQPGDTVLWHGRYHTITTVDRRDGWAWPIAIDGRQWPSHWTTRYTSTATQLW